MFGGKFMCVSVVNPSFLDHLLVACPVMTLPYHAMVPRALVYSAMPRPPAIREGDLSSAGRYIQYGNGLPRGIAAALACQAS